jgi:alkanesulfonate monooxygenase SsuD/methylene tetrahydromethanopterin reductase-like flavin-dependent oxidoreductase (luciferase family)
MRYENPRYMVEDAGAADLIAGSRLQLGISRGSPEQVIDGWRHFGYRPAKGEDDADMGCRHAEGFLELLRGRGFAQPNLVQCSRIRQAFYVLSHTLKDCVIVSGGGQVRTQQPFGPPS